MSPAGEPLPSAAEVTIDEVTDDDVAAVVALWQACDLTRPWNDPDRDIANVRATASATVLVARGRPRATAGVEQDEGGRVLGSVMAGFDGHRGWLYYLAVDPACRGRGLGRDLVVAAEAWLVAQGAEKVQLMVRETNTDVVAFYDRLGYEDARCVVLGRRFV